MPDLFQLVARASTGAPAANPTAEIWSLFAVGAAATMLRLYARVSLMGFRHLWADDFLASLAVVFFAVQATLGYKVGQLSHGLANNGMSDALRAALSPSNPEYHMRVVGSKIQVAGWTTYSALIWTLKLSMLAFYIRLTAGVQGRYRSSIYVGFGLVGASFVAAILAIYLSCRPFHKYWQINPNPGVSCQAAVSRPIVWSSFAANISTDVYLILIPIPLLWQSSLRMYKKVASTIVFGVGFLVLVCATLKTVSVLVDPIMGGEIAAEWGIRECFVAMMATNLPMIFHLLRTWLRPVFGKALGTTAKEYKEPPALVTIGGGGGDHSSRSRRLHSETTYGSNALTSAMGYRDSEEGIVDNVRMHDMKAFVGYESVTTMPVSPTGIYVSNRVDVTREDSSLGSHTGERPVERVHETW